MLSMLWCSIQEQALVAHIPLYVLFRCLTHSRGTRPHPHTCALFRPHVHDLTPPSSCTLLVINTRAH